jgi:hypothetical protein
MSADELEDRSFRLSKLGEEATKLINDVKPFTDLVPIVMTIAAFLGGILLVGYAAKEHFFYDLSSIAALSLLFIIVFTFAFWLVITIIYGFISTVWLVWILLPIFSWIWRIRRLPAPTRLRPEVITRKRALFLFVLFLLWFGLLYPSKGTVPWEVVSMTGFAIGLLVGVSHTVSDEGDRRKLLFAGIFIYIMMLVLCFGSLLDNTMRFLNFRSAPHQLVSLNEQAYRKVSAIAAYAGVTVVSCQLAKDIWVLRETTLVWHGVGANAYLRIAGKADAGLLIPLPSDGVEVLNPTGIQLPRHCPWAVG